jgi:catechol 2,3-dioxygenase-like lactoylglutathione lyase family enzyme
MTTIERSGTNNDVQGKCYCGAIRFELMLPTLSCSHCHCEDCRRSHGAAFVTWTDVPRSQFRLLAGEERLRKFESHPGVRWGFCGECGTSFYYDCDDAPEKIYVTLASLEGALDRRPDRHYSFEEKAVWLEVRDSLPKVLGKGDEAAQSPEVGGLHHVEINVSDLNRSAEFWGWFLGKLGYAKHQKWDQGISFRLGSTYLVFVQTEDKHLDVSYNRKKTGLNHLAFHAASRSQVDEIVVALRERQISPLYSDKHPHAGESGYKVFFEDPDRIKVELAAP